MRVRVALTPGCAAVAADGWPALPGAMAGVAIDVLRATTTLTVARHHGAGRIVPLAESGEAIALRARESGALACGEREGRIVPGFDLGNSPFEYAPERVAGRTLAFASTNGSRALIAIARCGTRWLGTFVSAGALVEALGAERFVLLVCAGKLGGFALEDAACAGWICARLEERGARLEGRAATLARALEPRDAAAARAIVEGCSHGRYLRALGPEFARDVDFCAGLDTLPHACEF
ncbi:MAG: 2-phosphosulfolactate phosphatase [Candidatus Eisenbacteria bacterium]|nr:2-phosphosulfolactate phosphatase [Candidatus Eisenbacteria bacterium]